MKLAGRFAHRKLPEYLFPGGAPRHRRGYSHWRECIVNLQTENGDHFSLRNRRGIRNSASNGGFGADFTGPGTDLPFCVVGPACPAGFAMQNIFGVAPCRRWVDGMAGGAVVSSDAVFERKGSGKQKLLAAFNHAEKRGGAEKSPSFKEREAKRAYGSPRGSASFGFLPRRFEYAGRSRSNGLTRPSCRWDNSGQPWWE
jgi:hypothetical protein